MHPVAALWRDYRRAAKRDRPHEQGTISWVARPLMLQFAELVAGSYWSDTFPFFQPHVVCLQGCTIFSGPKDIMLCFYEPSRHYPEPLAPRNNSSCLDRAWMANAHNAVDPLGVSVGSTPEVRAASRWRGWASGCRTSTLKLVTRFRGGY